jgi:hypothetical protein
MKFTICDLRFTHGLNLINRCVRLGFALMVFGFLSNPCKGGDAETSQQIVGSWMLGKSDITTFNSDGSYTTIISTSKDTNEIRIDGLWLVKDDFLISTNSNQIPDPRGTTAFNPNSVSRSRIIHVDATNLVLERYGITNSFNRK